MRIRILSRLLRGEALRKGTRRNLWRRFFTVSSIKFVRPKRTAIAINVASTYIKRNLHMCFYYYTGTVRVEKGLCVPIVSDATDVRIERSPASRITAAALFAGRADDAIQDEERERENRIPTTTNTLKLKSSSSEDC